MQPSYIYFILILFSSLNLTISIAKEQQKEEENTFVPTNEWKAIHKDQKIPAGLHIRINLQTGLKEAKLLDENDQKDYEMATTPPLPEADELGEYRILKELLAEAVKNIQDDSGKEVKHENTFRSYEELKQDLEELNLRPKTDLEILQNLIEEHKKVLKHNPDDHKNIVSILEDLDYLVHQYDNANEFIRLNGFREVILIDLNSTSVDVKNEALKLLGSSMQNNAKIQIHALELGCVELLLRTLISDTNEAIKSRAIFALGTLLRRFPVAQLQFFKTAGLELFIELLDKSSDLKVLVKVVTLINDIVDEYKEALNDTSEGGADKVKQYQLLDVRGKLDRQRWCHQVSKVLINVFQVNPDDHDVIEKCLNGINCIVDTCDSETGAILKEVLVQLIAQYKMLYYAGEEGNLEYYNEMLSLCVRINEFLNYKYKVEL